MRTTGAIQRRKGDEDICLYSRDIDGGSSSVESFENVLFLFLFLLLYFKRNSTFYTHNIPQSQLLLSRSTSLKSFLFTWGLPSFLSPISISQPLLLPLINHPLLPPSTSTFNSNPNPNSFLFLLEKKKTALHPPSRCRISPTRHGTIAYVGPVPELPGPTDAPWIGIILDEPVGKNDGRVGGKRYFECEASRGVFVRPDRVEKGDWGVLGIEDGEEEDGDLEEI